MAPTEVEGGYERYGQGSTRLRMPAAPGGAPGADGGWRVGSKNTRTTGFGFPAMANE